MPERKPANFHEYEADVNFNHRCPERNALGVHIIDIPGLKFSPNEVIGNIGGFRSGTR